MEKYNYYTLAEHPIFKYGDKVLVDLGKLSPKLPYLYGTVVGISTKNIIDMWMVDFGDVVDNEYPYHVINIPHIAIIKNL